MDEKPHAGRSTLILRADGDRPLSVLFEPAGGEYVLPAGQFFRLTVDGPESETVEVVHGTDYISVWPSASLHVEVYDSSGARLPVLGY